MLLLPKYRPLIAISAATQFLLCSFVLLRKLVSPTRLFTCSKNQNVYDFLIQNYQIKIFSHKIDKILLICDFDHSIAEKNSVLCLQLDDRCF